MHLQTTVDLKTRLLQAPKKIRLRILQRLTVEEKQQVFNVLEVTQEKLPQDCPIDYLTLVEYPDGWQLDMKWISCLKTDFHKVSYNLYATQTDAHNAYILGLVTWNELTESPLATQT